MAHRVNIVVEQQAEKIKDDDLKINWVLCGSSQTRPLIDNFYSQVGKLLQNMPIFCEPSVSHTYLSIKMCCPSFALNLMFRPFTVCYIYACLFSMAERRSLL